MAAKRVRAENATEALTAHNATLLAMRLPPEIFSLIVVELACIWRPSHESSPPHYEGTLGWMTASHVCASWRRIVISLSSLWAREAGIFTGADTFETILLRAQNAPMTLQNPWAASDDLLPEYYWRKLDQLRGVRAVDLSLQSADMERLADILHLPRHFELDCLSLYAFDGSVSIEFPETAPIPSLRQLSFVDLYIPFRAPNLASLCINNHRIDLPSVTCAQFLETLEACPELSYLELNDWAPETDTVQRKVRLPRLRTLIMCSPQVQAPYIDICKSMDLPGLKYLVMQDFDRPGIAAISSIFAWLLSAKNALPCAKGISRLSVAARERFEFSVTVHNEFDVRLDDGSLKGVGYDIYSVESRQEDLMAVKRGVHLRFRNVMDDEHTPMSAGAFFRCVVSGFQSHAPRASAIKSAYLDPRYNKIDWESVLRPLADVDTFYLSRSSHLNRANFAPRPDNGLLAALSKPDIGGGLLLPRLATIVCENAISLVHHVRKGDEGYTDAMDRIHSMLGARAAARKPLTRMISGSADDELGRNEREDEAEANRFFAQLISSYTSDD